MAVRNLAVFLFCFIFVAINALDNNDHGVEVEHGHVHEHSHADVDHHHHNHVGHGHSHDQGHGDHHHHHHHHHHHGHSHDFDDEHIHEHPAKKYQRSSNTPSTSTSSTKPPAQTRPPPDGKWTKWLQAIAATLLISAAPFFILFFIPLQSNAADQQPLLKVLLAFASGGLLGDAFLHLIPHAISPHSHHGEDSHDHSHSHSHSHSSHEGSHDHSSEMIVGLWVLAGLIAFLMVEKFVRLVKGGHGHSHGAPKIAHDTSAKNGDVITKKDEDAVPEESDKELRERKKTDEIAQKEVKTETASAVSHDHGEEIKVAGYLNLAADFTHNFTDGLAIGASFLVSRNLGIITTLTILLHEVPHEIGDFAILVQSGCNKRKAMLLQLTTATGALAGTFCGLLAENMGESAATLWILPFTAGGFIYIATVSVIPELLEDTKVGQTIKELVGLLVGVLMMVLIAKFE